MEAIVPWRKKEVREHLDKLLIQAEKTTKRAKTPESKARANGRKQALVTVRRDLFGEE